MTKSKKRDYYIAIAPTGGMHAGNPPPLDLDTEIYGPYTKEQAGKAGKAGEKFPDETFTVVVFNLDGRPPFKELLKWIKNSVKEEQKDNKDDGDE